MLRDRCPVQRGTPQDAIAYCLAAALVLVCAPVPADGVGPGAGDGESEEVADAPHVTTSGVDLLKDAVSKESPWCDAEFAPRETPPTRVVRGRCSG